MSSITLIILEIFSEASLISVMALIISVMLSFILMASLPIFSTRSFASLICSTFTLVLSAISFMEAVISSVALACCVAPCASAWLASDTCSAPTVTCMVDSLISESILLFSRIMPSSAFPSTSLAPFGFTSAVRSPTAIISEISPWYLILSMIFWNSSTTSPNSSFFSFVSVISALPTAISLAALVRISSERRISLRILTDKPTEKLKVITSRTARIICSRRVSASEEARTL